MTNVGILFSVYIISVGIAYYIIFRKHHKRNNVELSELISLISRFYVKTSITLLIIALGIFFIINANDYKDERGEVILRVSLRNCNYKY